MVNLFVCPSFSKSFKRCFEINKRLLVSMSILSQCYETDGRTNGRNGLMVKLNNTTRCIVACLRQKRTSMIMLRDFKWLFVFHESGTPSVQSFLQFSSLRSHNLDISECVSHNPDFSKCVSHSLAFSEYLSHNPLFL